MKTSSMSISEFLNKEREPLSAKIERHFKKYGTVYKIAGLTVIFLTSGSLAFAADPSGIGVEANKLYRQLVGIGKWVIIFKGGFDIIKSMGNGDVEGAKKNFFGYLLMYVFLLALPYGMDKVDELVTSVSAK